MSAPRTKRAHKPTPDRAARLWPYPLWSRQHSEEPAYALLARTIEQNLPGTFSARAVDLGAYGGHSVTKIDVAQVARLCEVDPETLMRSTPSIGRKYVTLLGDRFRRDDFSVARRRWCPGCLSEHGRHLAWWDLTIITSCPRHRVGLVDRCPCGLTVRWKKQHAFSSCSCGRALADASADELIDDQGDSDRYLVGRLTGVDPVQVPFLDRLPLLDAINVLRSVGHLAIDPLTGRRALENETGFRRLFDAGYRGVSKFPLSFRTLLDSTLAKAEVPQGKFGIARVYGRTFTLWLQKQEPASVRGRLSEELRTHAEQNLTLNKSKLLGGSIDRRHVSMATAAEICGVSLERMRHLLRRHGLLPNGVGDRSEGFERGVIETIASKLHHGSTFQDVACELNIWPHFIPSLIEVGVVARPVSRENAVSGGVLPHDTASDLMERLLSTIIPGSDVRKALPIPLASKSLGISLANVLAEVLSGTISAVGVLPRETGLHSILVDVAGQRAARRILTSETMTAGDIARTHGVSWEDACGLLKIGAIAAERDGQVWEVDKEVADEFFRVHAFLRPYAKKLRTSAKYLALCLESAGYRPAYAPPSTIRKFFKRADVEAYLGREGWPPKDWRVRHPIPDEAIVSLPPDPVPLIRRQ